MDNFTLWLCCFLPLIIILWTEYERGRKEKQRQIIKLIQKNKQKGLGAMSETFERFIGKECVITTMNATITGVVGAIEDNWIIQRSNGGESSGDMVNVDYISRIREYPRNKSGKKKVIFS